MKIKILYNICYSLNFIFQKKFRQPVQLKMSEYHIYLSIDMMGKNAKLLKTLSY